MNTEPLDVYNNSHDCLQNSKRQHGNVIATSPEPPAQTRENGTRRDGQHNKAKDVVTVGHVASANCLRGEKVAEKGGTEEHESEPKPKLVTRIMDEDGRSRSHCSTPNGSSHVKSGCVAAFAPATDGCSYVVNYPMVSYAKPTSGVG